MGDGRRFACALDRRTAVPRPQWMVLTAVVGLGASILGATAVILASNAGAPRATRDDAPAPTAVLQQVPAVTEPVPQQVVPAAAPAPLPAPARAEFSVSAA